MRPTAIGQYAAVVAGEFSGLCGRVASYSVDPATWTWRYLKLELQGGRSLWLHFTDVERIA